MRLVRLRLQNFRQFRQADITFSPGLTAIIGPNGSGKTTILEAITWALYGENRKTRDTLRYFYADPREPTAVHLTFALGDALFLVERNFRTATLKQLQPKETVLATGLKHVTEKVERLLNLTYEQFKNSYYTEQKDLTFLRFSRTGREQEEIARMLGYDLIRVSAQKAKEKATEARSAHEALLPSLKAFADAPSHYEETLQAVENARRELQKYEERERELKKQHEQAQKESAVAQQVITLSQQVETLQQKRQTLNDQEKILKEDVQRALSAKERREALQPLAEQYEKVLAEREELRQLQNLFQERIRLEATLKALSEQLQIVHQELQGPPPRVEEAEHRAKTLRENYLQAKEKHREVGNLLQDQKTQALTQTKTLENDIKRLQKEIQQLQRSVKEGRCPTCGQPLPEGKLPKESHLQAELQQKNNDLQKAEEALKNVLQRLAQWEGERETLEQTEREYREAESAWQNEIQRAHLWKQNEEKAQKIQAQMAQCQKEIAKLPDRVDEKLLQQREAELKKMEPAWREFQQLANVEETLKTLREREKTLLQQKAETEKEIQEIIQRISDLGMSLESASEVLQKATLIQAQWQQAHADLRVAQNNLQNEEKRLKAAEQRLKEYQEIQQSATRFAHQRLLYETLREALEAWRVQLNSETKPLLEAFAGEFLALLSGNRYNRIALDERFEPTLYEDQWAKPVISGGEQDLLALALRLALARLIQERSGQPLSLLILDEVFGSLDPERRRSVLEQLEALRGSFEQIIAISHIEQINEAADRCLLVQYDPQKKESFVSEFLPEVSIPFWEPNAPVPLSETPSF
jgi:exonuclease SbcC